MILIVILICVIVLMFIRKRTKFVKSGGNYRLIAVNVGCIYKAIKFSPYALKLNKGEMLHATALIDLISYIDNEKFSVGNTLVAVVAANAGLLCPKAEFTAFKVSHSNDVLQFTETDLVINLAMQIETMIFGLQLTETDAINTVLSNKKIISDAVVDALHSGKYDEEYNLVKPMVMNLLGNQGFLDATKAFPEFL